MGRIKGWKKVHETKKLTRYRSNNYQTHIEIYKIKFTPNDFKYFIDVITPDKISSAEYSTKKEASDRAIKYMRKHPKG